MVLWKLKSKSKTIKTLTISATSCSTYYLLQNDFNDGRWKSG